MNDIKKLMLVSPMLMAAVSMQAIDVKGVVIDKATGEPLIGATVQIEGTTTGAVTDIDGRFELAGMPGLTGTITFKLFNYYRETVWKAERSFTLDQEGRETLSLDLDGAVIGKGVFVLQAEYHPAGRPVLTDYFRMSILEPLSGKHSNRDLLGTSINFRHIRAEEFMKQLTRCGFGAYTYGGFDQREPGAWLPIRAGFHCYGAMLDNSSQVFSP